MRKSSSERVQRELTKSERLHLAALLAKEDVYKRQSQG